MGLSIEHTQKLATSLGMSIGGKAPGLQSQVNSRLDEEFGFKLGLSSQKQDSTTLTLTNANDNRYRLFALWHVEHWITVDSIRFPWYQEGRNHFCRPTWVPRGTVDFVLSNEPFITYIDIDHP
jgi:hypothetical protein